ncbi:MAG: hypothetical protein KA146_01605 [Leptospiraceae bacterium]|nr:hypothetical protein [Leptospiraceae bacterium]
MKIIWKNSYNYKEHKFSVEVHSIAGNLYILAFNTESQPILVKMNDENGKETIMRLSGKLDWLTQEDLTYNGHDPEHWLSVMIKRIVSMVELSIDNNKNVNV